MSSIIRDAETGQSLSVNREGRALTSSVNTAHAMHHSEHGDTFHITSGFLTTGSVAGEFRGVLFFKNLLPTNNILIGTAAIQSVAPLKVNVYKNATSMSNGVLLTPSNSNFASSSEINSDVETGGATSVITGGVLQASFINTVGLRLRFDGSIILGPLDTISVEVAPLSAAATETTVFMEVWKTHTR